MRCTRPWSEFLRGLSAGHLCRDRFVRPLRNVSAEETRRRRPRTLRVVLLLLCLSLSLTLLEAPSLFAALATLVFRR